MGRSWCNTRILGGEIVGCKWVFKKKEYSTKSARYITCLVAKNYSQTEGVGFNKAFFPVVSTFLQVCCSQWLLGLVGAWATWCEDGFSTCELEEQIIMLVKGHDFLLHDEAWLLLRKYNSCVYHQKLHGGSCIFVQMTYWLQLKTCSVMDHLLSVSFR